MTRNTENPYASHPMTTALATTSDQLEERANAVIEWDKSLADWLLARAREVRALEERCEQLQASASVNYTEAFP